LVLGKRVDPRLDGRSMLTRCRPHPVINHPVRCFGIACGLWSQQIVDIRLHLGWQSFDARHETGTVITSQRPLSAVSLPALAGD